MGTDTHIILVPAAMGATVPTPGPHPFNGVLNSGLSSNVFIEGRAVATRDSIANNVPPHLPIPTAGSFQKPPSNQGRVMMGSATVSINGKQAARNGDPAMT